MTQQQIIDAILAFINAKTWPESQQFVQQNALLLLTVPAEQIMDKLIAEYHDNEQAVKIIRQHQDLLRQCREVGINAALAPLTTTPKEEPSLPIFLAQELPLAEIEHRYANEWVVVEITAFDKYHNPRQGIVIAHDPQPEPLNRPTRQLHLQKPEAKSFTFYAGPLIPEGTVLIL